MAEAAGRREHDECDIDIAENREFVCLFDEAIAAFGIGDLAIGVVFDSFDL